MRAARSLAATFLMLALPGGSFAQSSPEEQARGLLEDGRTYRREGKSKQALDNFQTVVTGFSNTTLVDDALLEIGRHHLEVERDPVRAREAFEQVSKRFPQSDAAPGAYHHLGLMTLVGCSREARRAASTASVSRPARRWARAEANSERGTHSLRG